MRATTTIMGAAFALATLLNGSAAFAEDDEGWGDESAAEDEPETPAPAAEPTEPDAERAAPEEEPTAADGAPMDPPPGDEEEGAASDASPMLLGLRYRGVFLPQAVLNWFIDGGENVYVHGVGPELAIRDGGVEYILSAWLAFYDMGPVAIKGSSDDEFSWEIVESQIKSLYFTADYLGHTRLARTLELSYGGGAGLGILFGALSRTQAALSPGGSAGDAGDYVKCTAIGVPDINYCDDFNDHYGDYSEPNWFEGGTKPILFPWLVGQVGLRYQPHPKFVGRLDLGLGTSGVFFGVGADYGL